MSLIDGSYFKNEIYIPNILENGSYTDDITDAIEKYEPDLLNLLLGYELYKALLSDLNNGTPQSQRFKDLVNGAEFTLRARLLKWDGLKNMIAYYVYFNYVYYNNIHLSGVGSMQIDAENSKRVSPFDKLQVAWDRFQKQYAAFDFYETELYFRDEGMKVDNLPGTFNMLPTAYNFLYTNKSDYSEWVFTPIYDKNIFSL